MNQLLFQYIFFLLLSFSFQQYEDLDIDWSQIQGGSVLEDINNCIDHEDTNTCSSVTMKSGIYQCCKFTTTYYNEDNEVYYDQDDEYDYSICSLWVSVDFTDEQIKSIEESYQESSAFVYAVFDMEMPSFKIEYNCPGKDFSLNYNKGSYNVEEMEILKDPNYCLRLYYKGFYKLGLINEPTGDEETIITKEDCMNAKILPNS